MHEANRVGRRQMFLQGIEKKIVIIHRKKMEKLSNKLLIKTVRLNMLNKLFR